MKQIPQKKLTEDLNNLSKAIKWLSRSYEQCQSIEMPVTEKDMDAIDALFGRFSRLSHLLIERYRLYQNCINRMV